MASLLSSFARFSLSSPPSPSLLPRHSIISPLPAYSQLRFAGNLAPNRVKHRKAHKGRVPIPIGGSLKGTTLSHGNFGIRVKGNGTRLSAKQLQSADTALKRKLRIVKGAKTWLRVFPDIPVCIKGNETRMGKGKGNFDHWACRCPTGRVLFEVGGDVSEQLARDALRLVADKLPCKVEFITRRDGPRLGTLVLPVGTKSGGPGVLETLVEEGKIPLVPEAAPPVAEARA
ncbi:hypothetical protein DACRYDRAFT_17484 [Dacryopinax primogenitus]|uniref:Uncharacterized protein n=1 Tax=Dacryopinax primogenitus (strain DJM 731) TaxID=1858805 RepID=M5FTD6_DACPD|nr:uncharacterized protein DACRYDRAFT_17484 [Dacryopinax primogenitus]EJT99313.1 hypothetical protein DACRYDRAFT_17484 [Dacryopinax primogenitus]